MLYDYAPDSFDWANRGLKHLSEQGQPVVLLKQVKAKPGSEYMVFAPVIVAAFDDQARKFRLDLRAAEIEFEGVAPPAPSIFSKHYAETTTQARLHQAHFRRAVLDAYQGRCCICQLRERPLLDAAHIIADRLPDGLPTVRNGLTMCPSHHRAYDRDVLTITHAYRVRVNLNRLQYATEKATIGLLIEHDGREIWLPKHQALRPEPRLLSRRSGEEPR